MLFAENEKTSEQASASMDFTKRGFTSIRILIFFLIVLSPMTAMVIGFNPKMSYRENRSLAPAPRFTWKSLYQPQFKKDLENFFNDRFGLRKVLTFLELKWNVQIVQKPMVQSVLIGKESWLYYLNQKTIKKYVENFPPTDQELDYMTRVVSAHNSYCLDQGIHYLLVIAPDKQSIYPEYLPDWLRKENSDPSPLDYWIRHLRSVGVVPVVDLRDTLLNVKKDHLTPTMPLYWKTDTHWTELGAFFGYQVISEHLRPWLPRMEIPRLDQCQINLKQRRGGDLSWMVGMGRRQTEFVPEIIQKKQRDAKRIDNPKAYLTAYFPLDKDDYRLVIMETGNASLPKAVMFRDSFAGALEPLLSENFQRIVYRYHHLKGDPFDLGLIASEKPEVVIFEIVERNLATFLKMKII